MSNNSSLYGNSPNSQGNISSSNLTTLYSGNAVTVPANGNLVVPGTLTVNGCAILSDCTAFSILPHTGDISIGEAGGTTTILSQLLTENYAFPVADGTANQVLITNGAGVLSFADVGSLDTNYTINASTTTGGANFNLVGSDATTDTIKFASGTGITVTRTDADTITITNSDPGSAGVTSITGTTNQVIASSPTGAVTLSLPQDIATSSSPVFAGASIGQITVGITDDSTISSTSGNLFLDSATNVVSTTANFYVQDDLTVNNGTIKTNSGTVSLFNTTATGAQVLGAATTISMAASSGTTTINNSLNAGSGTLFVDKTNGRVGINNTTPSYELHIDRGADGFTQLGMTTAERTALWTLNDANDLFSFSFDGTNRLEYNATTGNQWFNGGYTGINTNTPAYTLDVNGTGNFQGVITGGLKINGSSSGYSNFIAPATGSTLNYQLPDTAGAANTVLTNDGSGNLSWALPGGGGSTFGNITVGIVTDNTISTTTGDLVLDSSSGTIAMNVPTITTDQTSISLFPTTTTEIILGGTTTTTNVSKLDIDNVSSFDTATITTTSTATATLYATTRNAMTGLVNIKQGTNVHCVNYTVLRINATTAMLTTYAEMYNNIPLANLTADVSGGGMRIRVTPTSATSTVFYGVRTSLD